MDKTLNYKTRNKVQSIVIKSRLRTDLNYTTASLQISDLGQVSHEISASSVKRIPL